MRQRYFARLDDIVIEDEIEIERARRTRRRPRAPALALQIEKSLHQLVRREIGLPHYNRIQIRRLRLGDIDGLGFENRGDPQVGQKLGKSLDGPRDVAATIAEVGAEGDGN